MSQIPSKRPEYLKRIAIETAKMSYPSRIGGILKEGAKKYTIEEYFVRQFPLDEIWDNPEEIANNFDEWHRKWVNELSEEIKNKNCLHENYKYNEVAVAAKLLNTFLHQLMKYEEFRSIYANLHLPLDSIVFKNLREWIKKYKEYKSLFPEGIFAKSAYSLLYDDYMQIQNALKELVKELNDRPGVEYKLKSRIELNLLLWS